MAGLPGDSPEIFRRTVQGTIGLKPAFVRLYPALVIKDTPLEKLYREGRYNPLSLDTAVTACEQALLAFEGAGIEVIRIGLQPTEELAKAGTIVAGPYHPAFRQLVESAIMVKAMRTLLREWDKQDTAIFRVHPSDVSNATGQKRANVELLQREFRVKAIRIRPDDRIRKHTAELAVL